MLLVVSLLLVLGVLTLPFGLSFYASTQLYETTEGIHDALKRAQIFAVSGRHDSAYGVYISEGEYVFFEGDTYATREVAEDQIFPISGMLAVQGITEVVFEAHTGVPSQTGSIEVWQGDRSTSVTITPLGHIDH